MQATKFVFRSYFYSDPRAPHKRVLFYEKVFSAHGDSDAVEVARVKFDEDICICDHADIVTAENRLVWEDGIRTADGNFGPDGN